jgi:hypothetical protein
VSKRDVESWLTSKRWQPLNRRNYIRDVSMFFEWAVSKELCPANPLARIPRPVVRQRTPEIFSVEKAARLLETAAAHLELELLPAIAMGLFAGLRICELKRLDWSAVKMDDGHIVLGPEVVNRITMPRNVDILPNLAAWLQPHVKTQGRVLPAGFRGRRDELCRLMETDDWPDNGLRHSFASYHLVKFDNAQLTAAPWVPARSNPNAASFRTASSGPANSGEVIPAIRTLLVPTVLRRSVRQTLGRISESCKVQFQRWERASFFAMTSRASMLAKPWGDQNWPRRFNLSWNWLQADSIEPEPMGASRAATPA